MTQIARLTPSDRLIAHPWLIGILACILSLMVFEAFIWVERDRQHQAERAATQAQVATVRGRLESEVSSTFYVAMGLSTFVLANPDFNDQEFTQVAASLVRLQPHINNIDLAPDNVIRHIYPREGNQRVLGLNLMLKADQREAVLRLILERKPVLAGPLPLVQGGTGIIQRIPIFLPQADGSEKYWGMAAAVVDPEPIFRSAGLLDPTPGSNLQFALRGRDGRGAEGEVFLGDAALFQDPRSVLMDIVIPGGKWQLAARHVSPPGSLLQQLQANLIHVLALAVAVGTGLLLAILLLANRRIRALAMVDPLTGVASRHQFNLQVEHMLALAKRSKRPLTLMMLDLNGFKQVNDLHGHAAGDALLHHVAGQIQSCLRDSDLLARSGGDEFMVLLPDTHAGDHLLALFARIRSAVGTPLRHGNVELKVTPSIGAATWTDGKQSIEEVLRQADQAMYQDKLATK